MNSVKLFEMPKGNGIVRQVKRERTMIKGALGGCCIGGSIASAGIGLYEGNAARGIMCGTVGAAVSAMISYAHGGISKNVKKINNLKPEYNKIVERAKSIYQK